MSERTVRIAIVGLGNLGRRFVHLLGEKEPLLRARYGLDLRVVGAADSRGTAYDPTGLDLDAVVRIKEEGGSVGDLPQVGRKWSDAVAFVRVVEADLLCEASPVHLDAGGEPGLSCIRTALARGMHVVTPNKGPIVLAYSELTQLAAENNVCLRFDGTVAGGLPALYLGMRDLRGATIARIEAVPNLITGFILDLLAAGIDWDEAVRRARAEGALEADANWDLDGWDAAAKLAILANAVLSFPARLEDVNRVGIKGITIDRVQEAARQGKRVRLLASATRTEDGQYALSVTPQALSPDHPLARLGEKEMGIVYHTDIYGTITATIEEHDPLPSAATMLRDILDIFLD